MLDIPRQGEYPKPRRSYPVLPPARPADLLRDLASLLRGHGLTRLYTASCFRLGVLSVTPDLTVWTNGRCLVWQAHGAPATCGITTAADLDQAARELASLARTHL